jgi:hypothetical protein
MDPAAGADLNAQIRPYRSSAAAASDDCNGRGVDHRRGYKAAPGFRQYSIAVIPGCATWRRPGIQKPGAALSGFRVRASKSAVADLDNDNAELG